MNRPQLAGAHKPLREGSARLAHEFPSSASGAYAGFVQRRQALVAAYQAWLENDGPTGQEIALEVDATFNVLRQLADIHLEDASHG